MNENNNKLNHEQSNNQTPELNHEHCHDHNNESNHDHSHGAGGHVHDTSSLSGKKIFWVTMLNAIITVTEIIGGLVSGSLSLLSDAVHNLSDTIAIALSYFANKIAQKPKDIKKTFGYKRAEILAAFINSTVLFAISIVLIFEAFVRWQSPETINGTLMIIVASIGLVANFVSVFLLEKDSHENLNIKSSYLHLLSDTVSSVGVLLGGIAIQLWNIVWIDPLITLLISLYILKETWHVIKKTVDILMESSPAIDYDALKKDIENFPQVKNLHHVHAWMSNEKTIYFEAHVELEDMLLSKAELIYDELEEHLKKGYNISHVTLQAEVNKCTDKSILHI